MTLRVRLEKEKDATKVVLTGSFDSDADVGHFKERVTPEFREGKVVLDMGGIHLINSKVLSALAWVIQKSRDLPPAKKVTLAGLSKYNRNVLDVARVSQYFKFK
jgi:anti-anti-sigma regulatory factor